MYKEIKLPFFIETRVETVKQGYAKKLEEIGCTGIAMELKKEV